MANIRLDQLAYDPSEPAEDAFFLGEAGGNIKRFLHNDMRKVFTEPRSKIPTLREIRLTAATPIIGGYPVALNSNFECYQAVSKEFLFAPLIGIARSSVRKGSFPSIVWRGVLSIPQPQTLQGEPSSSDSIFLMFGFWGPTPYYLSPTAFLYTDDIDFDKMADRKSHRIIGYPLVDDIPQQKTIRCLVDFSLQIYGGVNLDSTRSPAFPNDVDITEQPKFNATIP